MGVCRKDCAVCVMREVKLMNLQFTSANRYFHLAEQAASEGNQGSFDFYMERMAEVTRQGQIRLFNFLKRSKEFNFTKDDMQDLDYAIRSYNVLMDISHFVVRAKSQT